MGYRIRDWDARYEVNDKNRALKPGEKMRQGALEYLRFPVHGRDHSAAYRRFLREAKDDAPAVYGVYVKIKEIAAQSEAGKRGVIRNDSGDAIEAEEIADLMGFPVKIVAKSLAILCRETVGWVEQFREVPGNPGISPSESYTETEAETDTEPHTDAGAGAGGGDSPQSIFDAWNESASKPGIRLEHAKAFTDKRKASAKERLSDKFFRENWRAALAKVEASKFHQGCGQRGWIAGLDYFLRPDSVTRIMERSNGVMGPPTGGKHDNGIYEGETDVDF